MVAGYLSSPAESRVVGCLPNRGQVLHLGSPSYAESRDQGVAEVKRLINETPGTFGIAGFSQGGAVADLVVKALVEGDMQHRVGDCRWAHVFASPYRAKGKSFHLDDPNRLKFEGVAGQPVWNTWPIDYFAYAHADDLFTNTDLDNTWGKEIHDILEHTGVGNPQAQAATTDSVMKLIALINGAVATPANLAKTINTAEAMMRYQNENAHGRYNDPSYPIFGGRTALGHSINHLNYWGARI
ncbi:putative peptidoglycan-binding domain-containing protein [Corynebacterium humireducens NBRC 106098 = DSM 45392]|uniref:Putative peptidoglycan-binding domain-containing protein n=1 Tax=Corynebacterium humireducens NBRC 106098 = DSM 45392 TaxID=1223515 RepID=A0A0B5D112_9CORY|nr:hypothetical protein [Corynebacterium humireducens]AJE32500.1 putative peptidoglycan-binding domain-containing protein [Corynebacterium humireducens NBRC 106098 = DSM 45392]